MTNRDFDPHAVSFKDDSPQPTFKVYVPLRIYTAFVAVEYDFKVIARSEEEAVEAAERTWSQALAKVAVAHVEVELADEALDSPDLSE